MRVRTDGRQPANRKKGRGEINAEGVLGAYGRDELNENYVFCLVLARGDVPDEMIAVMRQFRDMLSPSPYG